MPHLIVEYSANLESEIESAELLRCLHDTAASIDALPTGGIRTRAVRRDACLVADGHPDNGFIYVVLRIGKGRSPDVQKATGETLFAALTNCVRDVYDRRPLSLGLEIQEIDTERRWKLSNIRDYMSARESREQ